MACRPTDCPLRSSRMQLSGFSLHADGRRTSLCGTTITFDFFFESVGMDGAGEWRDGLSWADVPKARGTFRWIASVLVLG